MDDSGDVEQHSRMRDDELLRRWCSCDDHEHLTPHSRALVEEMECRGIEL